MEIAKKIMKIKLFTAQKSIEIAYKYTKMTKSKKTSKTHQKDIKAHQNLTSK